VVVELAPVRDPAAVPATVLRSIRPGADLTGTDPAGALVAALGGSDLLLVLDNCEHVLSAAGALTADLIRRCPSVTILATSREALGVPGELVLPLSFLAQAATAELLIDRAADADQAAADRLARSPRLTSMAAQLEGVPLAVELAAARAASLTVDELAESLSRPLAALAGGPRHGDPRQQTMRATLDWSWRLLEQQEQRGLRRLAPFTAWFTAEDAAAVDDSPIAEVADILLRLRSRSLLVLDTSGQRSRFRLLEPVRQYAHERLTEADETKEVQGRFVSAQIRAMKRALHLLPSGPHLVIQAFDQRRSDVAAAVDVALQAGDTVSAMRLLGAAGFAWSMTDPSEAWRLAQRTLAQKTGDESAVVQASFALGAGMAAQLSGNVPVAHRLLEDAAQRFNALGNRRSEAWALFYRGRFTFGDGRWLAAALSLFQADPPVPLGCAWVRQVMGCDLAVHGRRAEARELFEEALAYATEHDLTHTIGALLCKLGTLDALEGEVERAQELVAEGVALYRALGDRWQLLNALIDAGKVAILLSDPSPALQHVTEALRLAAQIGTPNAATEPLVLAAELLRRRGDHRAAATVYAQARQTWPHDQNSFTLLTRYVLNDKMTLEDLATPKSLPRMTLTERITWTATQLQVSLPKNETVRPP
jgi:predicted ATPase